MYNEVVMSKLFITIIISIRIIKAIAIIITIKSKPMHTFALKKIILVVPNYYDYF